MQNDQVFENILNTISNFQLRQAVERLREGLFDPLGVKILTTGESTIQKHFETQTENLQNLRPAHLCVCGAYGQGKSHTLNYIRQRALEENYIVSSINLDPREVPLHNLKQLYRSIMENLTFPNNIAVANSDNKGIINKKYNNNSFADIWKQSVKTWLLIPKNRGRNVVDMIPEEIPHRFKAILTAMAQQTESIPNGKSTLKKYAGFKPKDFPWILLNAFMGKDIPLPLLRNALKYRQVSFYNQESLTCRDLNIYLEAIKGYGSLFQTMGYKGFVLLFDEAESIMLSTIRNRSKSYCVLHDIFCPKKAAKGFLPVFAFTDDFFTYLKNEDFERTTNIKQQQEVQIKEIPIFPINYSNEWNNINIYKLRNLTSKEWHDIILKLIEIHALAYSWKPDVDAAAKLISSKLLKQSDAESRMKLKLIVNILDIEQQQRVISKYL